MTKTNELIILTFFMSLIFLTGYNALHAEETNPQTVEQKCYKNEEFMKLIDDEKFVTVFNVEKTPTRTIEVMVTPKRSAIFVEYESSKDGSATRATEYCVTQKMDNPTFNDTFIEYLHNILEKAKGQKT